MKKLFNENGISLEAIEKRTGEIGHYAFTKDLIEKNLLIEIGKTDVLVEGKEKSSLNFVTVISADIQRAYYFCLALSEELDSPITIVKKAIDYIRDCPGDAVLKKLDALAIEQGKRGDKKLPAKLSKKVNEIGKEDFNHVMRIIKNRALEETYQWN